MPSILRGATMIAPVSIAAAASAWAHPHVFIDSSMEFELKGEECVGAWQGWTFDSTFYCASRYREAPSKPAILVAPNEKYPVYYNPLGSATDSRVCTKMEKGLQTAYPEEIRVSFE